MKRLKNVTERRGPKKESHTLDFGAEMSVKFVQHKIAGAHLPNIQTEMFETIQTEGFQPLTTETRSAM